MPVHRLRGCLCSGRRRKKAQGCKAPHDLSWESRDGGTCDTDMVGKVEISKDKIYAYGLYREK